jgi:hypothetical protein
VGWVFGIPSWVSRVGHDRSSSVQSGRLPRQSSTYLSIRVLSSYYFNLSIYRSHLRSFRDLDARVNDEMCTGTVYLSHMPSRRVIDVSDIGYRKTVSNVPRIGPVIYESDPNRATGCRNRCRSACLFRKATESFGDVTLSRTHKLRAYPVKVLQLLETFTLRCCIQTSANKRIRFLISRSTCPAGAIFSRAREPFS